MQAQKKLVTVFLIASLAIVNACYDAPFKKEKSDLESKHFVGSDFQSVTSAITLPRENQPGRKTTDPTALPKPTLISSDYLSAKNRLFHAGNLESSHVATNEQTLFSLHCQLTV